MIQDIENSLFIYIFEIRSCMTSRHIYMIYIYIFVQYEFKIRTCSDHYKHKIYSLVNLLKTKQQQLYNFLFVIKKTIFTPCRFHILEKGRTR